MNTTNVRARLLTCALEAYALRARETRQEVIRVGHCICLYAASGRAADMNRMQKRRQCLENQWSAVYERWLAIWRKLHPAKAAKALVAFGKPSVEPLTF